jgi:4-amino-4-deoxy-L-arabinose transferase-like glycosyltransferase
VTQASSERVPPVYRWLLLVVLLAVFAAGLAMFGISPTRVVEGTDAPQYDKYALTLEADRGFSSWGGPPFEPTIYREPLYPLFVATAYRLSGDNADLVALVQVVLVALTALLTFVMGTRLFGPPVALIAAALAGLSPQLLHLATSVLSEVLFTFLLTASLALALHTQRSGRRRDHLMVGIGLGLAIMVRAIAGTLVPVFALLLAFGGQQTTSRRERLIVRPLLVLVGVALVVSPWVVRNWNAVGRPALTSRSGVVVIRRAPKAGESAEAYARWFPAAIWVATNPISHLLVPISQFQWGPRVEDNLIWDFHVNDSVRFQDRYDPVCRASPSWDDCANDVGAAFVRKYPLQYALQSGFEFIKLHFEPLPGRQAVVHNATIWLALGSLAWLVTRRRLRRTHLLLVGPVVVYVGVSVLVDTQVRYIVPMLPVYSILAAVPLARAAETLGALVTRRARRALGRSTPAATH